MMPAILQFLLRINWIAVLDIIAVYLLTYWSLYIIKNARSNNLIRVILALFAIISITSLAKLRTLSWILDHFGTAMAIVGAIIFQPELRRAFDKIRRGDIFSLSPNSVKSPIVIKNILNAVDALARQRIGALIVLEFRSNLDEYIESGIQVRGLLSAELLINLFWPGTPTHDGAVIVRDNKILAAGCLLPLTESKLPDQRLGTRHMSALGLSEVSDALVIVISEETGTISIVENGHMTRYLNREALETRLFSLYKETDRKKEKKEKKDKK